MENKKTLADLVLGDWIKSVFYIKEMELKVRKNGRTIDGFLKILDKSGEMEAIYWDLSNERIRKIKEIQIARIEGQVVKQKGDGQFQMSIRSLEEAEGASPEDLIPSTDKDITGLMREIDDQIASVDHQYLRMLLVSFFEDLPFREKFQKAPAAKKLHQAYRGGLAEHTVNVVKICETICRIYPQINRDFLISTALLHDIGKIEEYTLDGTINYTDKGKLIGHIIMGTEMIQEKIRQIHDFPDDLAMMIKHAILSHHGKFEFGSPKLPSILPAVALFYADDTDAKINGLVCMKEQNKDLDKKWSEWVWWLERSIYLDEQHILADSNEKREE